MKCARSGLVSSPFPDEWLNTYGAYWHSQWDPPLTPPLPHSPSQTGDMSSLGVSRPDLPPAPFFKMNLSHIWGQGTARLSAISIWAQWFERYQEGCVKSGTIWIACELLHHVLLLVFCDNKRGPQAMIFFFPLRKCYPDDFSFTLGMIGSVNHVSCVWHVPLTCPPVIGAL